MSACIIGQASAFPPGLAQRALWSEFFLAHFGGSRLAAAAFAQAGVVTRHAVANPCEEDLSGVSTAARMERYVTEAVPLGKDAVGRALHAAGLSPEEIGCFVVVTCTGYATPGIDVLLARDLGMAPRLERVVIGHVGCHGAIPALRVARDHVIANGTAALVLSVELPSLHLQPAGPDFDQFIPHALFSDAAAAAVVARRGDVDGALALVDIAMHTIPGSTEELTWTITDHGFRMHASRHLPALVERAIGGFVEEFLGRHGLGRHEIARWAVHPGGPRILDVAASALGVPRSALRVSDAVLAAHGNCSSATTLVVLEEMCRVDAPAPGDYVVALAFGPGLTCAAALLRA